MENGRNLIQNGHWLESWVWFYYFADRCSLSIGSSKKNTENWTSLSFIVFEKKWSLGSNNQLLRHGYLYGLTIFCMVVRHFVWLYGFGSNSMVLGKKTENFTRFWREWELTRKLYFFSISHTKHCFAVSYTVYRLI